MGVPANAAFKLSVMARAGIFIVSIPDDTPTSGLGIPGNSGGSPWIARTLPNSISSLVLVCSMRATSRWAISCFWLDSSSISAYAVDILPGIAMSLEDGEPDDDALEDPEDGEESRREWRMYREDSLSISCCNSAKESASEDSTYETPRTP